MQKAFAKNLLIKSNNAFIETDRAKVISDAYPKAKYHFIVVCKETIDGVSALTRDHLPLLDHMKELATQIIEQQTDMQLNNFLIGFKTDAFMNGLNMHVISNDFFSQSMRRVQHWNGFHTELFITYQIAYALLRLNGSIESISKEKSLELRKKLPLHCNQCDFKSVELALLKAHLFEHWNKRNADLKKQNEVDRIIRMLDESKIQDQPPKQLSEERPAESQDMVLESNTKIKPEQQPSHPNEKPSSNQGNKGNPSMDYSQVHCSNAFANKVRERPPLGHAENQQMERGGYRPRHPTPLPYNYRPNLPFGNPNRQLRPPVNLVWTRVPPWPQSAYRFSEPSPSGPRRFPNPNITVQRHSAGQQRPVFGKPHSSPTHSMQPQSRFKFVREEGGERQCKMPAGRGNPLAKNEGKPLNS